VTWLNIYRREFIMRHKFRFEPGLRHQDIPWTTEVLLAAERVQYTSEQFYDYYIHSQSVSHKPDNDDTLMRSARHYMKILEMLDAINQRYRTRFAIFPPALANSERGARDHPYDRRDERSRKTTAADCRIFCAAYGSSSGKMPTTCACAGGWDGVISV
jgi:hypothetical protein